jgi:hypothetical protein
MNLNPVYKEFIQYKVRKLSTYTNVVKKIRSIEDLRFTVGLVWFALSKIVGKHFIDNETVRGR